MEMNEGEKMANLSDPGSAGLKTHLPVNSSHSSWLGPENPFCRKVMGGPLPQNGYSNDCCCLVKNQISD